MPGTASAGVDMTAAIGRASASSSPVSTTLSARNSVVVLPMQPAAPRRSRAPTAWPIVTVAPMARPTIMTVSMCMT